MLISRGEHWCSSYHFVGNVVSGSTSPRMTLCVKYKLVLPVVENLLFRFGKLEFKTLNK